ncbi:MAG: hypothetical protein LUD57_06290 [Ruminococcus sp.]|nr:hypothetical protein [Ruminococcus sp.]MCD8188201.1 hypothetical protein [Ruminococcus sp.]
MNDNKNAEKAAELAEMIDKLMASGNGSVNISALEDGDGYSVTTVNSRECGGKKGACCQPTELETEED